MSEWTPVSECWCGMVQTDVSVTSDKNSFLVFSVDSHPTVSYLDPSTRLDSTRCDPNKYLITSSLILEASWLEDEMKCLPHVPHQARPRRDQHHCQRHRPTIIMATPRYPVPVRGPTMHYRQSDWPSTLQLRAPPPIATVLSTCHTGRLLTTT